MSKKYAKVNVVNGKTQALTEEQQNCDVLCVTMFQDEKDKKIAELEAKLAEKEKELNARKKLCDLRYEQVKNSHKDKISFAIEKLEKIDEFTKSGYCFDLFDVRNEIDNQIKQLKGME